MRILYATGSKFHYCRTIFPELERLGIDYGFLALDEHNGARRLFSKRAGGSLGKYYLDDRFLASVRAQIAAFAPDIVHVTGLRGSLLKIVLAMQAFPQTALVYERVSIGGQNYFSPLDWWLFPNRRIDRVIMPSFSMLNQLTATAMRQRMFEASRAAVLHYAIPLPKPDPDARAAWREKLGIAPDAFVVGTVCHYRKIKNVAFLARAAGLARTDRPLVFLHVGGLVKDSDRREVGAATQGRAVFAGAVRAAADLMPVFDLYATPTRAPGESFGLAHAEAMSHGVATLCTAIGGPAEMTEDGVSGFVLPPVEKEWTQAIERLAGDDELRARMGAEGRRRIGSAFAPALAIERYLGVYRAAIAARRGAG